MRYKVFVVDDHPIVRQGLAQMINQEPDLMVCGDAANIPDAMSAIRGLSPDAAVVDLSLEGSSGIRLIEEIMIWCPLPILVLSMHEEGLYAERCLKSGARGYIMKKEPPMQVIAALRKVVNGQLAVSAEIGERLMGRAVTGKVPSAASLEESLSNRELEVFQLIGKGMKTREIAGSLNLSVKTIESHIDHIKRKLKIKDSRQVIMHAADFVRGPRI